MRRNAPGGLVTKTTLIKVFMSEQISNEAWDKHFGNGQDALVLCNRCNGQGYIDGEAYGGGVRRGFTANHPKHRCTACQGTGRRPAADIVRDKTIETQLECARQRQLEAEQRELTAQFIWYKRLELIKRILFCIYLVGLAAFVSLRGSAQVERTTVTIAVSYFDWLGRASLSGAAAWWQVLLLTYVYIWAVTILRKISQERLHVLSLGNTLFDILRLTFVRSFPLAAKIGGILLLLGFMFRTSLDGVPLLARYVFYYGSLLPLLVLLVGFTVVIAFGPMVFHMAYRRPRKAQLGT